MEVIKVNLIEKVNNSYPIYLGKKIFSKIAKDLTALNTIHTYILITDSNVRKLYADNLLDRLKKTKKNVKLITFKAGEKQKNRETKTYIENEMLKANTGRDSAIIALGGGVVGDIAGFVASTYARGIPYIQIPTTLVACVDSSIGGKTAVDTEYGKNLIGSFYQPTAVYIDIHTLRTLNKKEIREGLAEVIKYGVIANKKLFYLLEKKIEDVFKHEDEILHTVIKESCKIKAEVVEKDEKESNLRKILNFGHTIGHAVEQLSSYSITHGNSISIGMVLEGKIAIDLDLWNKSDLERLIHLLKRASLPTNLPHGFRSSELIKTMKLDKKARAGKIEMVLPSSIGKMSDVKGNFAIKVPEKVIKKALK